MQCLLWPGSDGQGGTGQRQAVWIRAAPARTEWSRAGSRSTGQDRGGATKGRSVPGRAVLDSEGPGRIGQGQFGYG